MKNLMNLRLGLLILAASMIFACKEKSPASEPEATEISMEVTTSDNEVPEFDPALDPLKVGAPYSRIYADTLNIQMYVLTLKPGDSMGLHQHLDHSAYVLEGGTLMVYIDGTEPVEFVLNEGDGFVGGPLTDAAVNIGDTDVSLLMNEVHRPR